MTSTPQLEDGHVRIANELYDRILGFGFKGHELKVVLAIVRKTYGYQKKEDDISASQIGAMCNVARNHVTTALNSLALRNVINKRPGRFGSIIGIQKNHRFWVSDERLKALSASPDIGQVEGLTDDAALVQDSDTCTEIGHVRNMDACSPDIGQVGSPDFGHTKDNFPKDNPTKTKSCAPKSKREPKRAEPAGIMQDRFDRFYAAYPKKKSRMTAEKAFAKLNPDEQLLTAMLAGIERAMTSGTWSDPKFIPHPATWLNAGGWTDEIQTEYSTAERAVIQAFNDALGEQLGMVPDSPFVESRAASIREFVTFSEKPGFVVRFFPWVRENTTLPPNVGFDFIIGRKGYGNITSGQHARKAT